MWNSRSAHKPGLAGVGGLPHLAPALAHVQSDGLDDGTTTPSLLPLCCSTPGVGLGKYFFFNILGGNQLGAAGNIHQSPPQCCWADAFTSCLPRQCHPSHGDHPRGQRRLSGCWPCSGGLGDV